MVQQATRNIIDETLSKGLVEGEKKGRIEGEKKGRIEGELERTHRFIQRQLQNRSFPVSNALEARLKNATLDELWHWSDRLDRGEAPQDVFEPRNRDE